MNYFNKRTQEEYDIIKDWCRDDIPSKPSRYGELVMKAANLAHQRKKSTISTGCTEEEAKLLDLFECSIIDGKRFNEETYNGPFIEWSSDLCFAIDAHYCEGYLEFYLSVGCGSCIDCRFTKHTKLRTYSYETLMTILREKLKVYKKRMAVIKKEQKERQKKLDDLEGKLAAVNTSNALMQIFGLRMDDESLKKVQGWQNEYEQLKKSK